jgi:hypothetical protein
MENPKQNLTSKKIKETATLPTKPDLITIPSEDAHSRLKLVFPSLTDKVTIYIHIYIHIIPIANRLLP